MVGLPTGFWLVVLALVLTVQCIGVLVYYTWGFKKKSLGLALYSAAYLWMLISADQLNQEKVIEFWIAGSIALQSLFFPIDDLKDIIREHEPKADRQGQTKATSDSTDC